MKVIFHVGFFWSGQYVQQLQINYSAIMKNQVGNIAINLILNGESGERFSFSKASYNELQKSQPSKIPLNVKISSINESLEF